MKYLVIGFYYQSKKRFRLVLDNYYQAMGINLWRGNVYLLENGKRKKIKSIFN